jgi:xylulokinase
MPSADTDAFIGIDLGTSGVRSLATDAAGTCIGQAHRGYPTRMSGPDRAEQDPSEWWGATCATLRELLAGPGLAGRRIAGVGLSGQMHGLVLVDAAGRPVRPAITWLDSRAASLLPRWIERLGEGTADRITGIPLSPGMFGPLLTWLEAHEPESLRAAALALLPKDYLGLRLTGVGSTDPTDATATLLFDTARRTWSSVIVERLGIRASLLPEVVETFAVRGRVEPAAARETGLPPGTPVIAGGGDTAMAACALALEPGRVSIAVNTGGTVTTVAREPRIDTRAGLHTMAYVEPGQWLLMVPILTAGEALVWFARLWAGSSEPPEGAIGALLAEAAAIPAGASGALFVPVLAGDRTDPRRLGAFVGLRLSQTRGALARAVLEGVAFELRAAFETIAAPARNDAVVFCSGGGFRSPLWRQVQADVLGRPLRSVAEDQHSARGAAWAASRAILGPGVARVPLTTSVVEPNPGTVGVYEEAYARYRQAVDATRPISHAIHDSVALDAPVPDAVRDAGGSGAGGCREAPNGSPEIPRA